MRSKPTYVIAASFVLMCSLAAVVRAPQAEAHPHVVVGSVAIYLLPRGTQPDIALERSEQTQRGWRAVPTPKPTRKPKPKPTPTPATVLARPKPSVGLVWPVYGHITTYFSSWHPAIDISTMLGTPVGSACYGTVVYAGWKNNGGGNVVDVRCANGWLTSYNHLNSISVVPRQIVGQRHMIGRVGMTGRATGPHLHFMVAIDGWWRNPLLYLP